MPDVLNTEQASLIIRDGSLLPQQQPSIEVRQEEQGKLMKRFTTSTAKAFTLPGVERVMSINIKPSGFQATPQESKRRSSNHYLNAPTIKRTVCGKLENY
jgi:hypothetical protein